MADLERRIRILTLCTVLSVTCVVLLAAYVMSGQAHGRFSQIDAERINIIGTNDRPVLVLSNRRLVPGPTMNGREYPRATAEGREFMSGMIFFNEEGDEVGGLIFAGIPRDDGYSAVGHLSFDQWKQNQVVALQYNDNGTSRRAGLNVWDRPTDATMDAQLDLNARMLEATPEERDAMRQQNADARARGDYGVQRLFVGSRAAGRRCSCETRVVASVFDSSSTRQTRRASNFSTRRAMWLPSAPGFRHIDVLPTVADRAVAFVEDRAAASPERPFPLPAAERAAHAMDVYCRVRGAQPGRAVR